jgi:hypothetical protein
VTAERHASERATLRARQRRRTALVVLAPLVSIATLMVGLRIGAGRAVRAASVFAAAPGLPAEAGARVPLAWQILTYLEDRSVRETIAVADLTVIARSKDRESRWTGSSNADGIAEASLGLVGLGDDDVVEVEVLAASEPEPLARGRIALRDLRGPSLPEAQHPSVRPSKREGTIAIDVLVEGERLPVGFEIPLWIRVGTREPSQTKLELEPEGGLRVATTEAPKAGCDGFWKVSAAAEGLVAGLGIDAKDASGGHGSWFGAIPVAPGAFFIDLPRFVPSRKEESVVLVAPNPRTVVYAEINDTHGRVFAVALPLAATDEDPVPRARLTMPPLAPGLHWIVASGEPRGAERMAGASIAKPFVVGTSPVPAIECALGPWLAEHPAPGFPRTLALDGMTTRGATNRARHRIGLFIGLVSLLSAAALEILLLTAAAREAKTLLADVDESNDRVTVKTPGGNLTIALLIAILGFALLAVLLVARG